MHPFHFRPERNSECWRSWTVEVSSTNWHVVVRIETTI